MKVVCSCLLFLGLEKWEDVEIDEEVRDIEKEEADENK